MKRGDRVIVRDGGKKVLGTLLGGGDWWYSESAFGGDGGGGYTPLQVEVDGQTISASDVVPYYDGWNKDNETMTQAKDRIDSTLRKLGHKMERWVDGANGWSCKCAKCNVYINITNDFGPYRITLIQKADRGYLKEASFLKLQCEDL